MSDTPDLQEMLQEEAVKESRHSDLMWAAVTIVVALTASLVFVAITVAGKAGNANNSSVRCDCRCYRCDDGDSGGTVLDSRANTGEARR